MTALDSNKVSFLQKIKELQAQIDALKVEAEKSFYWKNGPIICEINGFRWVLGFEADEEMKWADAKAWCELVGGELPPRDVLLQAYLNEDIKTIFQKDWYWSGTKFGAPNAWVQDFLTGYQFTDLKTNYSYVRAVKKVRI